MSTSPAFAAALAGLVEVSAGFAPPASDGLDDAVLMGVQRSLAEVRRRVDAWSASVAAEIAHRSRHELGGAGLAQRHGARTPQLLVQRLSGATAREAHTMVRVGALIGSESPLDAVGAAVADGHLTLDAADAIRAGLGSVDASVPSESVAAASEQLVRDAGALTVEKLAARARECAAELDDAHVQDRERAMRDARYLRITPQGDGMTRLSGLLDPESAAIVVAAYDAATSPRRGGPRFVDLIRIGSTAAPEIVGARRPAVRIVVTDHDLARRAGHGRIEGQTAPISITTIERELCDSGTVPIHFDTDGQILNVGREQRLFTTRQRTGLAVRDGGCRFPGCDRPPSWCEAHHINEWHRDTGRTDIADGILLCRHHHLLIHDNDWHVTRARADYYLVPPPSLDPTRTPIPAPPKTRMVQRMLHGAETTAGEEQTASPELVGAH